MSRKRPVNIYAKVLYFADRASWYNSGKWPTWCTIPFFLWYVYFSPLHVSSNIVLIIRRSNSINAASGIVTLCKWPSGMQDEGFVIQVEREPLDLHTGRPLTESDYTRCYINTIWPPDDEYDVARKMYRTEINVLGKKKGIVHQVGHLPELCEGIYFNTCTFVGMNY